ncbi:cation:proton antiporter [Bartonella sp. M0177]|uniref:Multicomponent K+:H+ antiporter subunit G n=1 Tax=Bartonella apis TaxID=1686310 RepID=A0A1R0FBF8_9HYPH|nr:MULTISPECIES: monovalent cation/H(+) antiporter subunit G [Bartonella]MBH9974880.1 cation:proton antiporter [Bartonella choladocola]MBI0004440.1 cation:proton antiporter [Bartonella sp. M0177]MBI0014486.1 cation:proton antiporter [Bartonella sp. B10834G3]MBI0139486.1 cation:proton antiporter [Bartonella choladocola]MCT6823856.1 monovalent cation/H(+) antiporter subunit G [Bartonella apis]
MIEDFPLWLSIVIVFFLLLGSGLTLIGAIGLNRAKSFYERLHMPTLGTSWGVSGIIIASIIYSTVSGHKLISHSILLAIFIIVTTPVTLMLLSRAAMQRDQSSNSTELPEKMRYQKIDDSLPTPQELLEKTPSLDDFK